MADPSALADPTTPAFAAATDAAQDVIRCSVTYEPLHGFVIVLVELMPLQKAVAGGFTAALAATLAPAVRLIVKAVEVTILDHMFKGDSPFFWKRHRHKFLIQHEDRWLEEANSRAIRVHTLRNSHRPQSKLWKLA